MKIYTCETCGKDSPNESCNQCHGNEMKTPYENHKELKHKTTWVSHNGIDKVEECSECLARFLHRGGKDEPPTSLFAHIRKEDDKLCKK